LTVEVFQAPRHMSRSFLAIVFLLVTGTCALAITGLFVASEISAEWALRGPGMPYHFQFWRVVVLFVAGGALAYALAQAAAAIEEGARARRTQFLAASFFGSFAVFLFGQYIEQNVSQCFNQVESCPFPLAGPKHYSKTRKSSSSVWAGSCSCALPSRWSISCFILRLACLHSSRKNWPYASPSDWRGPWTSWLADNLPPRYSARRAHRGPTGVGIAPSGDPLWVPVLPRGTRAGRSLRAHLPHSSPRPGPW